MIPLLKIKNRNRKSKMKSTIRGVYFKISEIFLQLSTNYLHTPFTSFILKMVIQNITLYVVIT